VTPHTDNQPQLTAPPGQAEVNHSSAQVTLNRPFRIEPLTEDYLAAIDSRGETTIDDVARTYVMLHGEDEAVRRLASKFWPIVEKGYFSGYNARCTYFVGQHAPWGIMLRANGTFDYGYPVGIASFVDAKWEILVHEGAAAIEEAAKVLKDNQRRIYTTRLFAQLHTLFSAIDAVVNEPDSQQVHKRLAETLDYVEKKMAELSQGIRNIAAQSDRRVAQQWYLTGMIPGLLAAAGLVFAVGALPVVVSKSDLEVAIAGGALGALLSVLGRTTSARFPKTLFIDTQAGTPLIISAGAFRPIVGSLLGLAVYVLIESGLLPLKIPGFPQSLYFIPAISFLAGFSERLAQDALVRTSNRAFGLGASTSAED
jgi:hypothetical protein